MKISYNEIISLLETNHPTLISIRNFYHTFGYITISNAISDDTLNLIKQKIINLATPYLKKDINNNHILDRNFIFHKVLETNTDLLDWFLKESYLKIGKFLLGDNMVFFNSDANIFLRGARFHRDHASILPSLKILSYLQDSENENGSGDLFLIPGSHLVSDQYSSYLTANSSWPIGDSFQSNFNNIIDNSLIKSNERIFDGSQFPAHQIKINKNDLIFFDNRILHTTVDHFKPFARLNFSVFFLANPIDFAQNKYINNFLNSKNSNELDDFFLEISKHENCSYHSNLNIPKYKSQLENNLYFSKYGFFEDSAKIFPSAQSQIDGQLFHTRNFIFKKDLF